MKNKKGFSLFELLIALAILGTLIPLALNFLKDENIGQKVGGIVKEFKQEVEETKVITIATKPVLSNVECLNGKRVIHVNGEIYHIGKIDSWGDIKSIDCNTGE